MRRLLSIHALIIAFFSATVGAVLYFNLYKPRILILQSHSDDYSWTRDVNIGIQRVLSAKLEYAVRWFYMDTERHSWPKYRESIGHTARRFIEQWQPDVVLAVDDDAQEYVMKYFVNHPHIRIVFAGVNGELTSYGYDQATNVTGILKRKELQAIKDALLSMTISQPTSMASRQRKFAAPYSGSGHLSLSDDLTSDPFYLKLFPRWREMVKKSIGLIGDESKVARVFDWSPIRLANIQENSLSLFDAGRETLRHMTRDTSPITEKNRAGNFIPAPRILHLGDSSTLSDDISIRAFDWVPIRLMESRLVETFPEWQAVVEEAVGVDLILITHYGRLFRSATDHTVLPTSEVVHWTLTHSPVPVMGTDGLFVEDGGYLAIGASPFEQGEIAARMALDIVVQGAIPRDIPMVSTEQFTVFMRGQKIRESGLQLPRFYESFARATHNYFD